MAVSGSLNITTSYSNPSTANTIGTATDSVAETWTQQWTDGTGAGAIDRTWSEIRTLTATSVTLDLTNLTGPRGAVAFVKVRELSLNVTASTGILTLGGEGSANEWVSPFGAAGDKLKVASLGKLVLAAPDAAGYAVGSTNKLLKIDAGAGTITYRLVIKGTSA